MGAEVDAMAAAEAAVLLAELATVVGV